MDRDEKERFFSDSGMPRLETLAGKNIALFGLSANPPTGYQGYRIPVYLCLHTFMYVCIFYGINLSREAFTYVLNRT